jgi:hypothetical protein
MSAHRQSAHGAGIARLLHVCFAADIVRGTYRDSDAGLPAARREARAARFGTASLR